MVSLPPGACSPPATEATFSERFCSELLELEVERRRRAGPDGAGLNLGTWALGGVTLPLVDDGGHSH